MNEKLNGGKPQASTSGMYSVRDAATEIYNVPFFAKTNLAAIRQFEQLAKDESTDVHKYPDDFVLYRVGNWNEDTGWVEKENLIKLAHARDFTHGTSTETAQ